MHDTKHFRFRVRQYSAGLVMLGLFCLAGVSCSNPQRKARRTQAELEPGWPKPNNFFHEASFPRLKVNVPEIADAEFVNDDELCMTCHEVYVKTFEENVHRGLHEEGQSCEACHGPASEHVKTRGKEPGLILSFKQMSPPQASEICMKCHEQDACARGPRGGLPCTLTIISLAWTATRRTTTCPRARRRLPNRERRQAPTTTRG